MDTIHVRIHFEKIHFRKMVLWKTHFPKIWEIHFGEIHFRKIHFQKMQFTKYTWKIHFWIWKCHIQTNLLPGLGARDATTFKKSKTRLEPDRNCIVTQRAPILILDPAQNYPFSWNGGALLFLRGRSNPETLLLLLSVIAILHSPLCWWRYHKILYFLVLVLPD